MARPQPSLGARMRALRQARGMSQIELAEKIGRHQTAIGPYERDEYAPPRQVVERIAEALDTTPEFLLFGRDPRRTSLPLIGRLIPGGLFLPAPAAGSRAMRLAEERLAAVSIEDDSMAPLLRPGQLALVRAEADTDVRNLIGFDVLAELADGRALLRRMHPAAQADRYDLTAYSAPTLHGIEVIAARPLLGVLWPGALVAEEPEG
ncbi:MAG: helix-turn-helix domain-containing protein [Geminicoccaceae bacterium]